MKIKYLAGFLLFPYLFLATKEKLKLKEFMNIFLMVTFFRSIYRVPGEGSSGDGLTPVPSTGLFVRTTPRHSPEWCTGKILY